MDRSQRDTSTELELADGRGLYLIDPGDHVFAVSALPDDGTDVLAVSWSGRVALLRGNYPSGLPLAVLDLVVQRRSGRCGRRKPASWDLLLLTPTGRRPTVEV